MHITLSVHLHTKLGGLCVLDTGDIFLILIGSFPIASSFSTQELLSVIAVESGGVGSPARCTKTQWGPPLRCVCQRQKQPNKEDKNNLDIHEGQSVQTEFKIRKNKKN